ncbi:MAG: CsbD family protein [Thermoleophilia bacterium]|nr:CsbD family protein [Thermoleophilia bacterium]
MASDILEGKWKQMRGDVKTWWAELTDDEIDQIGGKKDQLVGKLQEKYGWEKAKAENEVDKKLAEYKEKHEVA